MNSLALSLSALAFAYLAPPASAQRSVQVGLGYDSRTSQAALDLRVSHGSVSARRGLRGRRGYRTGGAPYAGYARAHAPRRIYVPGRYECVTKKVWVAGATHREWCPPVYETRCDLFGNPYRALVQAGYYRTVQEPGFWDHQSERVWVSAHWETR